MKGTSHAVHNCMSHTALHATFTVLCFTDEKQKKLVIACAKALSVGSRGTIQHSASPCAVWAS